MLHTMKLLQKNKTAKSVHINTSDLKVYSDFLFHGNITNTSFWVMETNILAAKSTNKLNIFLFYLVFVFFIFIQ